MLPEDACRHFLNRAGLPLGQHAAYMASVPPASVWARMCRNLAMYARQQNGGTIHTEEFWAHVESGLDEVAAQPARASQTQRESKTGSESRRNPLTGTR